MVRFSDDGRHFFQEVTVPVRFVVRGDTQRNHLDDFNFGDWIFFNEDEFKRQMIDAITDVHFIPKDRNEDSPYYDPDYKFSGDCCD